MSTKVYVFADWYELAKPALVGTLRSSIVKNKEHFSFAYDNNWLRSSAAQKIDPSLEFYAGEQHSDGEQNFGAFLDSCPGVMGKQVFQYKPIQDDNRTLSVPSCKPHVPFALLL